MRRLTVGECRPVIARSLKTCATDSRIPDYLNDAEERLIPIGKWVGTMVRYRICTSNSCIIWARQIETIEGWANCQQPLNVRGRWYEFMSNGPGLKDGVTGSASDLIDRDPVCTFDSVDDNISNLAVQSDVPEASNLNLIVQGYDPTGQWIRTQVGGVWIDGEQINISTTLTISVNQFVRYPTAIIKPVTNGPVRLYQYNLTSATIIKPLGYYEPDETLPIYRRSLIPNLSQACTCNCNQPATGTNCTQQTVTVLAKLRHLKVTNDNDFLVLQNLAALKLGALAVFKEENNLWQEADAYWARATLALEQELDSYEGAGAKIPINIEDRDLFGAGSIESDINLRW
jgi:hypothetical protein